jgi:glycosyltransferase involved in cell wall biosynthesis
MNPTKPLLSAVIITRNEQDRLRACLESVKWADEIIVVDSYSTDRTVEIAREYTDKIYQREFSGFGPQKNYALSQARGEWILSIDADEVVTPELRDEIRSILEELDTCGYHIPRKSHFLGTWIRHCGWWPDYVLRLFRRTAGSFSDRLVHEAIQVHGKTRKLRCPLVHYPYNSVADIIRKTETYTTLSGRMAEPGVAGASTAGKRIPLRPVIHAGTRFLKIYVFRAGFLDGRAGLILAILASYHVFLKYLRIWEAKQHE